MYQHQGQKACNRVQLGSPHRLDLLGEIYPVHVIYPLPAPKAAEQIGLIL
jgi:hypothetical protein